MAYVPAGADPVANGAALQAAITAAARGDTITIDPFGLAARWYQGNFTLPDKGAGTARIRIVPTTESALTSGRRVGAANVANLALLQTASVNTPVVNIAGSYWDLVGLEMTSTVDTQQTSLVATTGAAWNGILIDRCYLHGKDGVPNLTDQEFRRGVLVHGDHWTIQHSSLVGFRSSSDAQTVNVYFGNHTQIINCRLFATAEGVLIGGTDHPYTGLNSTDFILRRCYVYLPLAYDPYDPSFGSEPGSAQDVTAVGTVTCVGTAGTRSSTSTEISASGLSYIVLPGGEQRRVIDVSGSTFTLETAFSADPTDSTYIVRKGWAIKNLAEFKSGEDILLEQNIFDNCPAVAQNGNAVVFSSADQSSGNPWTAIRRVTVRKNLIKNAEIGIAFSGSGGAGQDLPDCMTQSEAGAGTFSTDGTLTNRLNFSAPHGLSVGDVVQITDGASPQNLRSRNVTVVNTATQVTTQFFGEAIAFGAAQTNVTWTRWFNKQHANDILIEQNLAHDISGVGGTWLLSVSATEDLRLLHNTSDYGVRTLGASTIVTTLVSHGLIVRDNIFCWGQYGFFGDGSFGQSALDLWAPDGILTSNVYFGPNVSSTGYPAGNFYETDVNAVGFQDLAGRNYNLITGPYRAGQANDASDGKDMGVDWDALQVALAGVLNGDEEAPVVLPVRGGGRFHNPIFQLRR